MNAPADKETHKPSNFLRQIIEHDLAAGTYSGRKWGGSPGDATHHAAGQPDTARIRTRFPPEPNGYLHVGHAKSICLNFGLARDYGGVCHLRFDDTNPEKEDTEYVNSIIDAVKWLGFDWNAPVNGVATSHLFQASDYFDFMYRAAEYLIETGHAYVDEQSADDMRANRGDFVKPGVDSPFRQRTPAENLARFREMKGGQLADGAAVLRAKIDMASPNINMRDPAIYRIRRATHHATGDQWCIYPMYSYAHPIEDALENITHSICTLEFEDQRPFYDWTLERIVPILRAPQFAQARELVEKIEGQGLEAGKEFALHCHNHADKLFASEPEAQMRAMFVRWEHNPDAVLHDLPAFFALLKKELAQFTPLLEHALDGERPNLFLLPHQHEFARLNLTYVLTSKRKLAQLVNEKRVSGWDDPRMPTIVGLRRRGYTPEAIQLFAERIGVTKSDSWIDYSTLEGCLRDTLDPTAPRAMAVLDPVKLVLTNWDEVMGAGKLDDCTAPVHPHHPDMGTRHFKIGKEVWIERTDYEETPPKGFFRLFPGNKVRLKYGHVIECMGATKDAAGNITEVLAKLIPDTKSGTPGSDTVKVKGVITWVGVTDAVKAEVRLYDRLFRDPQPGSGDNNFLDQLNPDSLTSVTAYLEPSMSRSKADEKFQFERHGYFVADREVYLETHPVFNLSTTLKDRWSSAPSVTDKSTGEAIIDISTLLKSIANASAPELTEKHDPAISFVTKEVPYVEPPLKVVRRGSDLSPFVIIRAPGAVGKSTLAQYVALKRRLPLWDLGKQVLGDHVFLGMLSNAFGHKKYSAVVEAIANGELPIVIDALDEAEVRGGSARLEAVLKEIADCVANATRPCILLFARGDTADYIEHFLAELVTLRADVPVYEIGYFTREKSLQLVRATTDKKQLSTPVLTNIFDRVELAIATALAIDYQSAWSKDEFRSFLGYAPVLLAISTLVRQESNPQKLVEEISDPAWMSEARGSKFLYKLISLLLEREQQKFIRAIQEAPEIKTMHVPVDWQLLYTPHEQLSRLSADKFVGITEFPTIEVEQLPPQIRKFYDQAINSFYPQHPFLRGQGFASPAFRDYLVGWALKSDDFHDVAEGHIRSRAVVPTPVMFSLYSQLPGNTSTAHAGVLIESFFAGVRSTAIDTQAILYEVNPSQMILGVWSNGDARLREIALSNTGSVVLGSRVKNITVAISGRLELGESDKPLDMTDVNIFCGELLIASKEVNIRSKSDTESVEFTADKITALHPLVTVNCKSKGSFSIISKDSLSHPWREFQVTQATSLKTDVQRVLDDLLRIMRWFRKDGKEEFGRYKDLIDYIAVGGDENRRSLLLFMLKKGLISERNSLYVMTVKRANELGITWNALRTSSPNSALQAFIDEYLRG